MQRLPTMSDIARRAGVTPMTVSRAMNDSGYVSPRTRELVMKAVRALNYRPNGVARSLKRRRTLVVGVLVPDIGNPFSAELVRTIEETLAPAGYSYFVSTTQRSAAREEAALSAFHDHRVDGLIVATRETKLGNRALQSLVKQGMPIVFVGRNLRAASTDRVTADHRRGGFDMTAHLIALGHRRVGFLGTSMQNGAGLSRFQGYLEAMREHGLEVSDALVAGPEDVDSPAYSTQADGYEGMKRLMSIATPPTAVFARNDYTAIGALCAAHDLGRRVPSDVAVAGFDNIPLAAYTTPALTTVEQCLPAQGREAAAFLLDRMQGRHKGSRREVLLDCKLVLRESTDSAADSAARGKTRRAG